MGEITCRILANTDGTHNVQFVSAEGGKDASWGKPYHVHIVTYNGTIVGRGPQVKPTKVCRLTTNKGKAVVTIWENGKEKYRCAVDHIGYNRGPLVRQPAPPKQPKPHVKKVRPEILKRP